ncbi:MAG: alcohol dehydrogenase, partial [Bacteroidetes bacterium SW_10_40_5]
MGITSKALVLNEEETKRLRIQEVELPDLKEGEALVKMKAAALNHRDQWIREGQYGNIKYPSILGSDGCGVLEHVKDDQYVDWIGKEVIINPGLNWGNDERAQSKNFEVLGMPTNGTFSEYFKIPASQL